MRRVFKWLPDSMMMCNMIRTWSGAWMTVCSCERDFNTLRTKSKITSAKIADVLKIEFLRL